ncbi:hypothetical protein Bca4012_030992 [Brassica carinata]
MIVVKPLPHHHLRQRRIFELGSFPRFLMPRSSASNWTDTSVLKSRALAANSSRATATYRRKVTFPVDHAIVVDLDTCCLREPEVKPPFTRHCFSPPIVSPSLREEDMGWRRRLAVPRAAAVKESS